MTSCANNLKQISMAIRLYATSHDDLCPKVTDVWTGIQVDQKLLQCASRSDMTNAYVYNSKLAGQAFGQQKNAFPINGKQTLDETQIMLAADGGERTPKSTELPNIWYTSADYAVERHSQKTKYQVSFMDGHVEVFKKTDPFPINIYQPGVKAEFWAGTPALSALDATPLAGAATNPSTPYLFHTTMDKPIVSASVTPTAGFTIRWKGYYNPAATGDVIFKVKASEGSTVQVRVNKTSTGTANGAAAYALTSLTPVGVPGSDLTVALTKDKPVELEVIYQRQAGAATEYYGFELYEGTSVTPIATTSLGYRD